ncbi:MAG: hypothetical protein AB1921_16060 [Thermodesulfobacteriota bacterium]
MKKALSALSFLVFLCLFLVRPAAAGDNGWKLDQAVSIPAIAASGSYTTAGYPIYQANGFFAAALSIAGSGTAQLTYQMSPDNQAFYTPAGASAILSNVTSSAAAYDQFSPEFGFYIRFIVTETGGVSGITSGTLRVVGD